MATVAKLEAYLSANTRDFDQAMDKSHHSFSKIGGAIGKIAAGAGLAVAAGLGIAAKIGFDEFKQGALVTAQTNAVIKSTGGIANVTAKQIDKLSTSLMEKSGTDDEVIKSGANMLLTFKNIRNEAGRGNDIFNQSTTTLLDMSTALGTDAKKSAIQLGKALQDPIKGISALSRVGVTFTDGQKKSIKALVEGGQTMEAQKIILAELNSEFGGSAEAAGKTLPGQLNILKETFSNTAGEIIGKFVPSLVQFASFVAPLILQALDGIGKLIDQFVAPAFKRVGDVASENWPKIQEIAGRVFGWIKDNVFPIVVALKGIWVEAMGKIRAVLAENGPELQRIFGRIGEAIKAIAVVVVPILRIAFVEVLPRAIGILITAIDLLSGAIEGIIKGFKWVGEKAGPLFVGFKDAIMRPIGVITDAFDLFATALNKIIDAFKWLIDHAGKITGVLGKIGGVAGSIGGALPNPFGEGGPGGGGGSGGGGGGNMGSMMGAANAIDAASFPYVWGGGHSSATYNGPYDCSGAVSALLRAGGLLDGSLVSGELMRYGEPGPGKHLTILANPEHTYAMINGRAWGTSGENPGGGAGWFNGGIRSGFALRHPKGFDSGGWLQPGLTLAYNNTGRPERVLGPGESGNINFNFPNYVGSKTELMSWLQNAAQQFKNQNGRTAFG